MAWSPWLGSEREEARSIHIGSWSIGKKIFKPNLTYSWFWQKCRGSGGFTWIRFWLCWSWISDTCTTRRKSKASCLQIAGAGVSMYVASTLWNSTFVHSIFHSSTILTFILDFKVCLTLRVQFGCLLCLAYMRKNPFYIFKLIALCWLSHDYSLKMIWKNLAYFLVQELYSSHKVGSKKPHPLSFLCILFLAVIQSSVEKLFVDE